MPDFNDLSQAISTLKGLHDGTIDPNTIDLPEDMAIDDDEPTNTEPEESETETEETPEEEPKEEEPAEEEEETEEEKKVQTPEENRKFAEQRRQQELEKRVQEELNKKLQESPEMQVARMLADQFGVTPQQMLEQIQLGMLQEQNPDVAPEVIQRQFEQTQKTSQLEQQLAELQTQLWERDIRLQGQELQKEYPILTNDDLAATFDYMRDTLGNTNIPLKQAVMAVHGEKIIEYQTTQARNELLAEKSGRKSPLTPQGGKAPSTPSLTPEEKQMAKLMGISEEDYLKYK
jgi:hypothetical protein